jgi:two-component system, NtrC family, sensor kinase
LYQVSSGLFGDREVTVFLVRSIRRRLVTGLTFALLLMLTLAAAGVVGLFWHRDAVDELAFLLYNSPDRDQLSRAFSRIAEEPVQPNRLDLTRPIAVATLQTNIHRRIDVASDELAAFRQKVEAIKQSPELRKQREQVLGRLDRMRQDLQQLFEAMGKLTAERAGQPNAAAANDAVFVQMMRIVARTQQKLDNLPAYHDDNHWLVVSLDRERRRSARLQNLIILVAAVSGIGMLAMMVCGFRWICNPLRAVARGACRIGNGDTDYRLSKASNWDDEFTDLVTNVNKMADRFLQAEHDLTAKVEERSEQLVRSQRLANVGFLAAGVAHEVNNPLCAISLASDSLLARLPARMDPDTPNDQLILERVQMIHRESRRCGEITRRLLDFAKGEHTRKCSTDLMQVVDEVLDIIRNMKRFDDRTIHFEHNAEIIAECNGAQIKQVILNLTANALQATDCDGHVWLIITEQVDDVLVTVRDDGCGMDPETLHHVFDPFWTTRETGQGTGLGLSISNSIIEEHGGTLRATSEGCDCGSAFDIRLPKRQAAQNAA